MPSWLSALGLALAGQAQAMEMPDTFQVHGFMSQALILTDHNDFFGPSSRDTGSLEYTELGLNASFRPRSNVLVAGQVLARRAGSMQRLDEPELDYGVVDYQFFTDNYANAGIQLGRFKNPLGLYNQTRDVAATRPSILLPQSIYFDRTRKPALSADGAMLYAEEFLNNGSVRFQFGLGSPRLDDQSEVSVLGAENYGDFSGKTSYIGQVRYEHGGGEFVLALTYADVNAEFDSRGARPGSGDFSFQPWILSFQYNLENWSFTTEYAIRNIRTKGFVSSYNYDVTGESWYVQLSRRLGSEWQWLLRYDSLVTDIDDRSGKEFAQTSGLPAFTRYAKDWTTGVQWQPYGRFMVSTELHHIQGTGWLPYQDRAELMSQEKYWNLLLFQASYFF
ncbi:hypothetical protein QO259_15305 [Salinicola sp. JS01]|uniref:hypothetical protein n=1 Tax=Salinicola sp. JS01 TaxID=3050071 RepID=UPI00255BF461|nr:hypothetical protein [Salinicola sp. JS01]WIX32163.1 hypothetical protein QO259_15305 [Salinicola sp. JS01]